MGGVMTRGHESRAVAHGDRERSALRPFVFAQGLVSGLWTTGRCLLLVSCAVHSRHGSDRSIHPIDYARATFAVHHGERSIGVVEVVGASSLADAGPEDLDPPLGAEDGELLHWAKEHSASLFTMAETVPRIERCFRTIRISDEGGAVMEVHAQYRELAATLVGGRSRAVHRIALLCQGRTWVAGFDGYGQWVDLEWEGRRLRLERADEVELHDAGVAAAHARDEEDALDLEAQEVSIESSDGTRLAGELLLPAGRLLSRPPYAHAKDDQRHPAAHLLGGSGPQDRDGNGEGRDGPKGFLLRDLARALSRRGLVTLRIDDRGTGRSSGSFVDVGLSTLLEDARSALQRLRNDPHVDPSSIVLVGHSEGGLLAAMLERELETQGTPVAGVALLSTPSESVGRLLREQIERLASSSDVDPRLIRGLKDLEAFLERLRAGMEAPPESVVPLLPKNHSVRWLREHLVLEPQKYLARIQCPVLVATGNCDLQVGPEHGRRIRDLLRENGHGNVELRELPFLDHFLMRNPGGDTERALEEDRRIDPLAQNVIAEWAARTVDR